MADNEHDGLDHVEPTRRKFLKSFLTTAFVAPAVASFALDGVAHAGTGQILPNQGPPFPIPPNHMLPNQRPPFPIPPNHMLPNQIPGLLHKDKGGRRDHRAR